MSASTTTYDRIVARRVAEALDGHCSATAEHAMADGSAVVERCIYGADHFGGHVVRTAIGDHRWSSDEWQHVCSVARGCP